MTKKTTFSDEELLLAARLGDEKAEAVFTKRMFDDRFKNARFVAPEACNLLDDWELNEAYFRAFTSSSANFRFSNVRFLSYFLNNLRHEIIHEATHKVKEQQEKGRTCSLDSHIGGKDGTVAVLSDFVASGDFMDDPHAFLLYAERLEELHRLPANADPTTLDVVRLVASNYTIADTARVCGISESRVSYLLNRYRKWVIKSKKLISRHSRKEKPHKGVSRVVKSD